VLPDLSASRCNALLAPVSREVAKTAFLSLVNMTAAQAERAPGD
jgi:hypothetical protein